MKIKKQLTAILLGGLFVFAAFITTASAQEGALIGAGCEKEMNGVKILYAPSRQVAAELYNGSLLQGDCAKMWNAGSKGWAVQVKMMPPAKARRGRASVSASSSSNSSNTTTFNKPLPNNSNSAESGIGVGCEAALKNAKILYAPSRQVAVDMYNASLSQGDCAKYWNAGSKGWAVQVKMMPPSKARRGQVVGSSKGTTTNSNSPVKSSGVETYIGAGCEAALKKAPILYAPNRQTAQTLYDGSLLQGDCAKMWNAGSKGWAYQVKMMPPSPARKSVRLP